MEVIRKIPDAELTEMIRSGIGIEEAIRALYRDNFARLSWYIEHNSGSGSDAEDIFQDVLLAFIDAVQRDKFRGESAVSTYLFSLNRFMWLNELKKRDRSQARAEKFGEHTALVTAAITDEIGDREGRQAVLDVVRRLGETCEKLLLLYYYENKSMKEILDHLDYENEQVLRNKKYKCLKQLESLLAKNEQLKHNLLKLFYE